MISAKEIRTKINSIKSTRKITNAMQMVSASKMRRAQQRMHTSRPYAEKILRVINHLARCHSEYNHIYMQPRETKRVGLIVISSDRGLCGGLNINLFKRAVEQIQDWQGQGKQVDLCCIGQKGVSFFNRFNANIVAEATHLGDAPSLTSLIGVVKVMLDAFDDGTLDEVHIIFNEFINTMSQKPTTLQLLPIPPMTEDSDLDYHWDYIYEPDSKEVLDALLSRYVESEVYQAVVENTASEQAARMVAMKNATENAGQLIDDLSLIYNKARQAAITQELAEIVGGAQAV